MTSILKAKEPHLTAAITETGSNTASIRRKGFTLIELMIVMTIVGILATIAMPNYQRSLIRAREAVLQENLYSIRSAIDQFYADLGKYPDKLSDLTTKRYLREIPRDPFTGENDTWIVVPPPADIQADLSQGTGSPSQIGSVYDLTSGSTLVGINGKPYSEW